MKNTILLILSILLFSCNLKKSKETKNILIQSKIDDETVIKSSENNNSIKVPNDNLQRDSILSLKFEQIHIIVDVLDVLSKRDLFETKYKDSIELAWGFEKLWNKKFSIKVVDSLISKVEVYQSYRTTLSILDDGAHLDLTDWYHYKSKWEKLTIKNDTFKVLSYTKYQSSKFPNVSKSKVLKRVIEVTGNDENKFVRRVKECGDEIAYPCVIGISDITLKIVLFSNDKEVSNKILLLKIPMGC